MGKGVSRLKSTNGAGILPAGGRDARPTYRSASLVERVIHAAYPAILVSYRLSSNGP
jgi:hypothetical protein